LDKSESVQLADNLGADEVVVTGSRVRPSQGSASNRSALRSSPLAVVNEAEIFLSELRTALSAGDRETVLQLTALPLQVHYSGGTVTYRKASELEENFKRIFTPAVRASLDLGMDIVPGSRTTHTLTVGRVTFGASCRENDCRTAAQFRIVAVTPG
jgi:hypothetical protein